MSWHAQLEIGRDRVIHTWPEHDEAEHVIEPYTYCWCDPQYFIYANGNTQAVHRDALDRLGLL